LLLAWNRRTEETKLPTSKFPEIIPGKTKKICFKNNKQNLETIAKKTEKIQKELKRSRKNDEKRLPTDAKNTQIEEITKRFP